MLETWLSKERLLSNSTPRFLTDDEESREQPSSVRLCSRLLLVGVLGPISNTSVFSEFSGKKLLDFYIGYAFHKFLNLVCFTRPLRNIEQSIISITMKANPCVSLYIQRVTCNGPSTEPLGTPYCTCDRYDTSSFTATNWWRSDKYDLNQTSALPLMPTKFSSLFKRMLWSIVSNAALRSSSTNREIQPRSDDKSRSCVTLMRAEYNTFLDKLNLISRSDKVLLLVSQSISLIYLRFICFPSANDCCFKFSGGQ